MSDRRALVFGGSGTVGREVVRALAREGVATDFVYYQSAEIARELADETGQTAHCVDLLDTNAVETFMKSIQPADVFIHCAVRSGPQTIAELTPQEFSDLMAVNCRAPILAVQALAPQMKALGRGDVVFIGALSNSQSVPIPSPFASTQGALSAMAMALAKELGPDGVRVNMMSLGLLGEGLSAGLDPKLLQDYQRFSALRRLGTAEEVAKAIVWLALENTYISGKVLPVNGGI